MASSPFRSKTRFHARSVSLPSTSHPLNPQFDEHLCRVRATEEASSSSLSSISKRLNGLEDLYDCVDDLLLLPHTQQAFFQERHEKWVGEALEGHLTLLDVCATAKDVLSQKKQNVQQLLSILRRRRDANDFGGYLTSRTKEKKVIQKSLKDLKNIKNKRTLLVMDKDHETVPIVSMLNEVEAVTLAVFESLLSYIAGTKLSCRVSAPEETSSSLSSISNKISGLEDLYDCVDDLLLLPHNQEAFLQDRHEKWVGEALEGHLTLLDMCATAKDVFSQTRQDVQQLLSTLRRKGDANDFGGYLISRQKEKKVIQKSLKDLKSIKNKHTLLAMDKDQETVAIVSMLNEVEAVTLDMFESLLSYIAGPKLQSRLSGWSLFSKLAHHKNVSCQDEETDANEFEKIDAALHSLVGHKTCMSHNKKHKEEMQNHLRNLESNIQDLEERLESLFRRLIKTRVSLLNILNH
ncbi:hypothetical protein F0562_020942 [Nyssa sinensis]|uniref:DUF241 domain-containing protein n=1 Tax=Nyssa sinensis TaxID=561372 RepID=A0A5J5BU67_9ASTE|nr:hypothetical protein F0562_020942 [Nyssa sinensis]